MENIRDKIIWIDDWPEAMQEMLSTFFNDLWDKEIRSEIAIFGDATVSEKHISDEVFKDKINDLSLAVYSEFVAFLLSNNMNVEQLKKKYKLIYDGDYNVFESQPESDIVKDKRELYQELKDEFDNLKKDIDSITEFGKKLVDKLQLKNYKYALIDLRLTHFGNDLYNKVYDESYPLDYNDDKPLMSMILYYCLSSNSSKDSSMNPVPIIYSSYTRPKNFAERWVINYKKLFSINDDEKIEIFNRFGQGVLMKSSKTMQDILCG